MSKKRHFFNMYLTTALSVAMVLFLIGLECVLLLSTQTFIRNVKQSTAVDIVLKQNTDTATVSRLRKVLDVAPYCLDYRYISSEEALQEHITTLGEDPVKFLGYNPLLASFEVHMRENYANPDSLAVIEKRLESLPYVEQVVYQEDLFSVLNRHIQELSWWLLAVAGLLLLISLVLIGNTIRLQIYSQRFMINTMRLVGAKASMIKAPIVRRSMGIGFLAGLLALVGIAAAIWYVNHRMGILLFPLTWQNMAFVCAVVMLAGLLITFFASLFAAGRYIRMRTDVMYEI